MLISLLPPWKGTSKEIRPVVVLKKTVELRKDLKSGKWQFKLTLKRTVKKIRLGCCLHYSRLEKGNDGIWSSRAAGRKQEAGTTGRATLDPLCPRLTWSDLFWTVFILRWNYNNSGFSFPKLPVSEEIVLPGYDKHNATKYYTTYNALSLLIHTHAYLIIPLNQQPKNIVHKCIVVNWLLINQTKTKQTNPFPRSDESLMSSANSI